MDLRPSIDLVESYAFAADYINEIPAWRGGISGCFLLDSVLRETLSGGRARFWDAFWDATEAGQINLV